MRVHPNQQQLSAGGANGAVRVVAVIRRQAPGARYQDWRVASAARLGTTGRGLECNSGSRSTSFVPHADDLPVRGLTGRGFGSGPFHPSSRGVSLPIARRRRAAGLQRQSVVTHFRCGGLRGRSANSALPTGPHQSFCALQDSLPGFPCMRPSHRSFAFRGRPLRGEQPTTEGVVNVRFQGGEVRSV